MRRAMLMLPVLLVVFAPTVARAAHIEYPEITADCQRFDIAFQGQYRSTTTAAVLTVVLTLIDEAGVEKLRFETDEVLELTGEKRIDYDYGWIWNDITDEYIHLIGLVQVHCELTLTAPWGDGDSVDVHTVEIGTHMVCDVVADEDVAWGEIKSWYR
jgi:hypothetical protein